MSGQQLYAKCGFNLAQPVGIGQTERYHRLGPITSRLSTDPDASISAWDETMTIWTRLVQWLTRGAWRPDAHRLCRLKSWDDWHGALLGAWVGGARNHGKRGRTRTGSK